MTTRTNQASSHYIALILIYRELAQTIAQIHAETEVEPKRGRPKGKRSHPDYEQVTAYIKTLTYQEVKIALLREGQKREFSELVQELLDNWLKSRS